MFTSLRLVKIFRSEKIQSDDNFENKAILYMYKVLNVRSLFSAVSERKTQIFLDRVYVSEKCFREENC